MRNICNVDNLLIPVSMALFDKKEACPLVRFLSNASTMSSSRPHSFEPDGCSHMVDLDTSGASGCNALPSHFSKLGCRRRLTERGPRRRPVRHQQTQLAVAPMQVEIGRTETPAESRLLQSLLDSFPLEL